MTKGKDDCKLPPQILNRIADPYFLVVPTGGCWARPDFKEIINRTVITKSIIAVDCSDGVPNGLARLIEDASYVVATTSPNDALKNALDKIVGCIVSNNGVISPDSVSVAAYVYEYNTQAIIATSDLPQSIVPLSYNEKYTSIPINGQIYSLHTYEHLLSNPSTWFEFVAPNVLDPLHSSFAYRFVSYAGEYYRLVIHIGLTKAPVLFPCAVVPKEDCSTERCDDDDEEDCYSGTLKDTWAPL